MAKSRPSVQKRLNEVAKMDKRQAKDVRKAQRDAERANAGDSPDGVDRDIAGIIPGPQPIREDM